MSPARKLILTAVVILVGGILGPVLGTQAASAAPSTQICNDPGNYCLNAWNGGPWIKTYTTGVGNNYFYVQQLTGMCNNGRSTSSCPLSGQLNIPGLVIYQIRYGNEYAGSYDNCLADDGAKDGQTAFGYCNGLNGTGGSDGTIFLAYNPNGTCPSGSNRSLSREWTDTYRNDTYLFFNNGDGNPVMDQNVGSGLCLYQYG